jgi:uncharacterized iron-regulated protein
MKKTTALLVAAILTITSLFGQTLTKKDLVKYTSSFTLDTTALQLNGNGWDTLKKELPNYQYVLLGEYHNSPVVSRLVETLFSELKKNNFSVWMTEISPLAARKLDQLVADKSYPKNMMEFNGKYGKWGYHPIPFFSISQDFDMLKASKKYGFDLWGIDQDFFVGFDFVIDDVYHTLDKKAQLKHAVLLDSVHKSQNGKYYEEFFSLFKNPDVQKIKNALDASGDIYNSGGLRGVSTRSNLMKSNFYNYYLPYLKANKPLPKIFFKAGSNHTARGLSPTNITDIGETIGQLAEMQNLKSLHIALATRYELPKEGKKDKLGDGDYPDELLELYNDKAFIMMDLRPLKALVYKMELKKIKIELSAEMIRAIKAFDFIILSPEVDAG